MLTKKKLLKRIEILEGHIEIQMSQYENLFSMIQKVNNHVESLDKELHPMTFQGGK